MLHGDDFFIPTALALLQRRKIHDRLCIPLNSATDGDDRVEAGLAQERLRPRRGQPHRVCVWGAECFFRRDA